MAEILTKAMQERVRILTEEKPVIKLPEGLLKITLTGRS